MKLKQITIAIENSPGRLYEVTNALGKAGVNLRAASLVDTGAFGQLRLLVSDLAKTRRILMKMQMPAQINEVVAVEIADKPGSLARMLKPLKEANVQIKYTYAFVGFQPGSAIMIFRFSDNDKAIEVLHTSGLKLLDANAFGILETNS
jgi:hypothetical protein